MLTMKSAWSSNQHAVVDIIYSYYTTRSFP